MKTRQKSALLMGEDEDDNCSHLNGLHLRRQAEHELLNAVEFSSAGFCLNSFCRFEDRIESSLLKKPGI